MIVNINEYNISAQTFDAQNQGLVVVLQSVDVVISGDEHVGDGGEFSAAGQSCLVEKHIGRSLAASANFLLCQKTKSCNPCFQVNKYYLKVLREANSSSIPSSFPIHFTWRFSHSALYI
jgi:hypothetical protein